MAQAHQPKDEQHERCDLLTDLLVLSREHDLQDQRGEHQRGVEHQLPIEKEAEAVHVQLQHPLGVEDAQNHQRSDLQRLLGALRRLGELGADAVDLLRVGVEARYRRLRDDEAEIDCQQRDDDEKEPMRLHRTRNPPTDAV